MTNESPAESGVELTGGDWHRQTLDTVRAEVGDVDEAVGAGGRGPGPSHCGGVGRHLEGVRRGAGGFLPEYS